jgi:crotonobetainyl-CoA:carnitine CoA-transferase CaiB-like acyl-CoA transferase
VLCEAVGRPEWATSDDYKDFKARLRNRAQLTLALDAALSARTTAEWIGLFAGRVPAAPVHDVKAALDNVFVCEGGRVRTTSHPGGDIRLLASPIRCAGEVMPCEAAPPLGSDTDAILTDLGYGPDEIARLRAVGAL